MVNPIDFQSAIKKRASWGAYNKKFADHSKGMDDAIHNFNTACDAAVATPSDEATALTMLRNDYENARTKLMAYTDPKKEGWIKSETAMQKDFDDALKAVEEKGKYFEDVLSGKVTHTLDVANAKVPVVISENVKKTFLETQSAAGKVASVMDSIFGQVKLEGLSATIKHNAKGLQVWNKEITKGRGGEIAIRGGSVVAGAALTLDALARGNTRDDEPRTCISRILEGATGIAMAGGGLVLGHAR